MLWGGNLLLADEKYTVSVEEAAQDLSRVPRLVDENSAPRYLIVEFSKTEAEQPAQDCAVQAAAQGENEGADKGADFGAARGDGAGL